MVREKGGVKHKIIYLIIGLIVLSIFQVVVIAQPEGWVLSGRVHMDDTPDIAGIQVYRHGTNELVNSSTTDSNGLYSIKLPNGEYDIKVESYLLKGSYNIQYDLKTIVINNSNVTLDFKASGSVAMISTVFFMLFIAVIFPSIVAGFIMAILIYRLTKKRKTAVIGFVLGTVVTCIIDLLMIIGGLVSDVINGKEGERSLDYYIGAERMINNAIQVFMTIDEKELHGAGGAFSTMLSYVSYEIERLSAFKNED